MTYCQVGVYQQVPVSLMIMGACKTKSFVLTGSSLEKIRWKGFLGESVSEMYKGKNLRKKPNLSASAAAPPQSSETEVRDLLWPKTLLCYLTGVITVICLENLAFSDKRPL